MDAETAFTTVALLLMITRTSQAHNIFGWIISSTLKTNLRVLKQPWPFRTMRDLSRF